MVIERPQKSASCTLDKKQGLIEAECMFFFLFKMHHRTKDAKSQITEPAVPLNCKQRQRRVNKSSKRISSSDQYTTGNWEDGEHQGCG